MNVLKVILLMLFISGLALVSACGDDDGPVKPGSFRFTIRVVDPDGDPVEGLDLSLAPNVPFYQDGKKSPDYRPAVSIPFVLQQESNVRMSIEDVEGNEVRLLGELPLFAGSYHFTWDGLDDNENRLSSGVYTAHLVVRHPSTDDVLYDNRKSMLMAILDAARYSAGTTDANGRIVLDDTRMFPFLHDAEDIPAVDENGEQTGTIRFTASTRFQLFDLTNGGSMRFNHDVDGTGSVEWEWDVRNSEGPWDEPVLVTDNKDEPPPPPTELGQPYPCPFN